MTKRVAYKYGWATLAMLFALQVMALFVLGDERHVFVDLPVERCEFVATEIDSIEFVAHESQKVTDKSLTQIRKPYPVRKSWWTINGTYPGREEVIKHLQSGQHAGRFDPVWLSSLSRDELHSLHSDDHEGKVLTVTSKRPEVSTTKQIVVVTANWCGACVQWARQQKPRLIKSGWKFGNGGQFREYSSYPGVRVYPSFVLVVDGKPTATLTGYQTAERLDKLYREGQ